ncbi:MAG: hypothetical protein II820_08685 [Ruminiclostridium sp.]|nr:hypothetical protein [Ruminiclostridium sp.]
MAELDDITGLLGGLFGGGSDGSGPDIDPETLLRILEIISKLGENDKNTELLNALRPHLRAENRPKLDRAANLMKIMSILPLLRDGGFLDGIFGQRR